MEIEKKAWPELFEKVLNGEKGFDIRLADSEFSPGDFLVLREWDPGRKEYTGRSIRKEVTFVLRTKDIRFWPREEIEKHGLAVLSLK